MQWGRVGVRGGSWNDNQRNARCAYRNRNVLVNFNNNLGFRVSSHDSQNADQQSLIFKETGRDPNESQPDPSPAGKAKYQNELPLLVQDEWKVGAAHP